MGSYKIRRLHLPSNVIEMLEKQNLFSCKDVLSISKLELQSLLGISHHKVESLLNEISRKCVSSPQTVYDIYVNQESTQGNAFLSLSLHSVDRLLHGGLPLGSITEMAGPPGVGKTQFCFMLSILTTLPLSMGGLAGQVIYIDTESAFCAQRLKNMAQARFPDFFKDENVIIELLEKVFVHRVNSIDVLKEVVSLLEKDIIRHKVKLIIVDSVASLIRKEFGSDLMEILVERNKILLEQAAILKDLARTYGVVVFLTNQITSQHMEMDPIPLEDFSSDDEDNEQYIGLPPRTKNQGQMLPSTDLLVDADHIVPALGNTWSHCVNTRLIAEFLDSSVCQLTIVKSPIAPNVSARYTLKESGIVLTDDDIELVDMSSDQHKSILTKYNFLTSEITGLQAVFSTADNTK